MIIYKTDVTPEIEQVIALYSKAKLNRPQDERRVGLMLGNANIKVSAWDGEHLVGFLRGFTDFCFDCYINDLAVDPFYQGKGIGKGLIEQLKGLIETETLLFLISAPDAIPFYRKLGLNNFKSIDDTWYLVNRK
jgi:ribosomal protein S18 acetylase RimI-like enzyme